ncbi:MAG: Hsp20/alpha crystallin family protein [Desulfobacteraceae bacterium]|nr:MAG: Hsp20/alpha crystallin family protein [Desulfobacteraceae bacterium]
MPVIKWDPFRNIVALQDRINRLFEDAFPRTPGEEEEDLTACSWRPLVDIFEEDEGIVMQVDLPGVKKEDVSVEVKNNLLLIQGQRQIETGVSDDRYFRRERSCGSFQRSFSLRSAVSPDSIQASFKNGVLTIRIPKPEEERPKKISVSVD